MGKLAEVSEYLREAGYPRYRFKQILDSVYRNHVPEFAKMSTLPAKLISELEERFGESYLGLSVAREIGSAQATKVLFALSDGQRVESVHMKFRAGWHSYCISSQVGCGFACSFCATGTLGLMRNLSVDEITEQVLHFAAQGFPVDSIAFMGMGEPLANRAVFDALEEFQRTETFALGARRLSVSTIGLPRQMRKLTDTQPQVNLTWSLHSPFSEQRSELMPINHSNPIEEVLETLDRHVAITNRKVYLAYVMLKGVNDTPEHAAAIVDMIRRRPHSSGNYHVNMIRYNLATGVDKKIRAAEEQRVYSFADLLADGGVKVTVRQSFGDDIDAACGQLFGQYESANKPAPAFHRPAGALVT